MKRIKEPLVHFTCDNMNIVGNTCTYLFLNSKKKIENNHLIFQQTKSNNLLHGVVIRLWLTRVTWLTRLWLSLSYRRKFLLIQKHHEFKINMDEFHTFQYAFFIWDVH